MKIKEMLGTFHFSNRKEHPRQLWTTWGETIDDNHILDEYPRPQMERKTFVCLNGWWEYAFAGKEEPKAYEGKIRVPFSPESVLSGVGRTLKPEEYLWYRRAVEIDQLPDDNRCLLHFGAVDQACVVWINGQEVLSHCGGFLPFSAEITQFLHSGSNLLVVRVTDKSDTSFHSRGKQALKPGGMFYTAQSGIWQTVWMEWVPMHYIESLRLTPDLDNGSVTVQIHTRGSKKGDPALAWPVEIDIAFNGLIAARQSVGCGKHPGKYEAVLPLGKIQRWTPEQPCLYDVAISYGQDEVKSYFAMRKFSVEKDAQGTARFCLNGVPYFMNGVLDQGYWPDGLMTPPSDEAFVYDIQKMKALGFNMLRKHCKIEPLRWYYHCDRLGMLVWQDMVNGGETYHLGRICYLPTVVRIFQKYKDCHHWFTSRKNQAGRREWMMECLETVKHLYNVPSLAVWVPFNEGWGQFDANQAANMIRRQDSTRLVDHASGWFDQGGGDFKSVHIYFTKLFVKKDPRAFVISEYGGYTCNISGHVYSNKVYGYKKFENPEEFRQAVRHLILEELMPMQDKGLCGAVYTQLSDVEEETNGLLTYDRKICKIQGDLFFNKANAFDR